MMFLLAVLAFLAATSTSTPTLPVIDLRPESPLASQSVLYGVPQLFRVSELQPATVYDIKVSYPSTQPSIFALQVERVLLPLPVASNNDFDATNFAKNTPMPPRRRVLNTAKLRLHPTEMETHESVRYRLEPSGGAIEVEFSLLAEVEGVRHPDSTLEMTECVFDIVVEEVLLEAFPRDTLVLIAWLVTLLFASWRWVLPYLEKKLALGFEEDRVRLEDAKDS
ncbi:uncharacterized protein PITG_05967 [Phytophthora infestans T30-4]|uniref:Transmembrane protein 231 n=2 Tax=Phytophthora infestans TaxID=4787 RepID=D0N647_PHYIT|nr:uncharacterized protein PITG_05967 [Phytophthora infestans T30-4]EEY70538.1 conserved hypothetical protein [Phytophthora infestans T30-4]KAF4038773.1 hypothetical protein GN244_ATG09108 [Phytophthora infestans]KAF4131556.1 hypothetical protein GN958_ATG19250 [Phytophthora infestans]KAI9988594.1 hypothetical protein PInf_022044 [Phytophthora infestans]|eukprot:XP_002998192.1 conserved hypothetical protein [Phytophthora infestans T30-4]